MNRTIFKSKGAGAIMTRKILLTTFLCLFFISFAIAQQPGEISFKDESVMPAGKKGERIQSIIDTLNSDNPERIRRFVEEECSERFRNYAPMDEHISVFRSMFRETGGMTFYSIRSYVPERKGETVVILKDNNFDSWQSFVVGFSDEESYLVRSLRFGVARTPSSVTEPVLTTEDVIHEVKELMKRLCDRDVFSGTVLIAKGEDVLYSFACGEASKRFHVPNNIDTKFNLGSMNKMFTSTSIVQLAEKGKLSFQDPISKYVDESWLPEEITSKVTIHHLLTHTSGLGSYFNETFMNGSRARFRTLEDFKPLVKNEKLTFEPGKRFRYSNTGMFFLGVVIESVTGQSYFDYIRENIYKPAGMTNSDSYEMDIPVENLAIGYYRDQDSPNGWKNNYYLHVIKGGPAGGGFSTVVDLHRFGQAILTEKLVSPESLEVMWKDYSGEFYGYGFRIDDGPLGKVVGHSGGFSGINANLDIFVDAGYIVAVMTNYDRAASPVARKIKKLLERTAQFQLL
jgi:CubicO group peptidase (beta-lactamase class C family)